MIVGGVFYPFVSSLSFLTPYLIFLMLLVPYCKLSFDDMRITRLHVILLGIQILRESRAVRDHRAVRSAAGPGHFHLRDGSDRHFGGRNHRYARRKHRRAGDLHAAEQPDGRHAIAAGLLADRLADRAAVLRVVRDRLPANDPAADPAVRNRRAAETLRAPHTPATARTPADLVLPVGRSADHRDGQHGRLSHETGCVELCQ